MKQITSDKNTIRLLLFNANMIYSKKCNNVIIFPHDLYYMIQNFDYLLELNL